MGLVTGPNALTPRTQIEWVRGSGHTPRGWAVWRGVGERPPRRHHPHPQSVGNRPRPQTPMTGGGVWESAESRTPRSQARGAPAQAPWCRSYSAQGQLARARAVGLVTGTNAHTPRTQIQWVTGPAARPQRQAVGRGRAPNPGRPKPRQEAPPPRRPPAAVTASKASSQERALWGW